ncbi:MAG TPA: endonuclease/exonuclease/phosphatase family protein [Gemmatales bacterium]|nr:endonuclease/exonuclease/phosphatase family protein [Gemmatales bacterium]HMP58991.1 endonuclease/exonuclease/phosphatase family protein [Gemmatales bacterium]
MIRLATFNVENLFDRPKIINEEDTAKNSKLLKAADQLQKELAKTAYDHAAIEALLLELKGYVTIRVDRGKFFKGTSRTKVGASGKADWEGAIEFTRARFSEGQRQNTAQLIKSLAADVMCLIEVEGRQALLDFMREYIKPVAQRLDRNMLIDSPIDPRGIDVAVAWKRAELGHIRSNCYDRRLVNGKSLTVWSRDCLEVELLLASGQSLWILANHFKSKMGGDPPSARDKRLAQSQRLVEILTTRYNLAQDFVVVMGDLNDVPDSQPLAPLKALGGLHDVFDVAGTPADDRWTYYYGRAPVAQRRTQIDYILVSEALRSKVSNVQVHRRGMSAVAEGKIPGLEPFPGMNSWKNAASDHAAVTADLDGLSLPS